MRLRNEKNRVGVGDAPGKWREAPARCVGAALALITFLLPLKFGNIVGIPELPLLYPDNLFAWLIIIWPSQVFSFISGLLLLAVLVVVPPTSLRLRLPGLVCLLWFLLAAVSPIGFINASTADFPSAQVLHFFGLSAFLLAVYQFQEAYPYVRRHLVTAVVAGAIVSGLLGVHQYWIGFEETREFVRKHEEASGVAHSGKFHVRLHDNRVFSTFSLCNSFAAHIILVFPLCCWLLWKMAGNIDPPRLSRMVLIPIAPLILLPMLALTGSRAAILAFGAAFLVLVPVFRPPRRVLAVALILGALLLSGALVAIQKGRGIDSFNFRIDYFRGAWEMFLERPWTGTGWGDYFHDYMQLKRVHTDEAPHCPHNLILTFASQTGIAGLLAATLLLALPTIWLLLLLRHSARGGRGGPPDSEWRRRAGRIFSDRRTAILLGWTAWMLHSLADINIQIVATLATAGILLILSMPNRKACGPEFRIPFVPFLFLGLALALSVLFMGRRQIIRESRFFDLHSYCDPRLKTPEEFAKTSMHGMEGLLRRCIEASPNSPFPYATAADFALLKGAPRRAEELLRLAIERSPERSSLYWRLGTLQYRQRRFSEARDNLFKAKSLFPLNPEYAIEKERFGE